MNQPEVTVIIPTYNRETLILKAINSVLNQTYQNFDIMVIDDASTDNTEAVVKGLNEKRITYLKLEKNGGQCIARNYGIKRAKGRYIAFLDSDDEWLPAKLEKQMACFTNGDEKLGSVYSYSYTRDMIKDKTSLVAGGYHRGDIYQKVLQGFCPPTPSLFLIKKEALEKINYFDEKLITFVDLDLHIRIAKYYHFDYVEEPLIIKYEQIGDQYVNNFDKRYNGFGLFKQKWESTIKSEVGENGFHTLKTHLVYSIVHPMLNHPPKNLRRNIPKLLSLLWEIRSPRVKYYLKSLLILAVGPGIVYVIRKWKGKDKKPVENNSVQKQPVTDRVSVS